GLHKKRPVVFVCGAFFFALCRSRLAGDRVLRDAIAGKPAPYR
ncbi:hypothetical protein QF017_006142, partial [Pseudomonas laurylsulfatiphila]